MTDTIAVSTPAARNARLLAAAKRNVRDLVEHYLFPISRGKCPKCGRPLKAGLTTLGDPCWRCPRIECEMGWLQEDRGEFYPVNCGDESVLVRQVEDLRLLLQSNDLESARIIARYDSVMAAIVGRYQIQATERR